MRKNLYKTRKNMNLTQSELAAKLGIQTRQYQNLEAGTSGGRIAIWQKLKELLNKPIDFLLEQED